MTHRLRTAVCKADINMKHALFPGNFKIFPQVQPKRLELRQFLSELSSHPPKGFNKPFNQKNTNNSSACTAGGIGADRKYSSLSGGADGREGDEDKSKVGPGSGSKNKSKDFSSIAGILGVCWVHLNKDLNWKGVVDKFLGRRTHLTQLVIAAKSSDPQIQFRAVNVLAQLLFSSRNPPIDFLISCNILPTLVDCLSKNEFIINRIPAIQLDALLALTKIIMIGTSEQSQAVVEAGAVPPFLRLLKSPDHQVRETALVALDNLIAKGPQLRDCVINLGVVASLLNCIQPDTTRNFLHEVLRITAWTLIYMTDGGEKQIQTVIDSGVLPQLVQLLNHGEVKVQDPALRAVGNIFQHGTDNQVQALFNCDALSHFHNLLNHPNKNICEIALLTLSKVAARDFTRVQAVIDAGLVPLIIHHMQKGDFLTQRAANNALSFMTMSGTKEQVEHLVDFDVIPLFINLLKCKDSVVVWNVLVGIRCILEKLPVNQGSEDKSCTINNGTNDQVQAVLNCDALSHFHNLLNHPIKNICENALWILSNVAASNFSRVQAVIDAGLVALIIHHLKKGDIETQKAAANALSWMTWKGTKEQVEHLIDCGVLSPFFNLLNSKDSEVVWDVLVGIKYILLKLPVNQGSGDKACTLIEECGGWDKMKTLQNHESMEISEIAQGILLKFSSDNVAE